MIDDETHPEMQRAARELHRQVNAVCVGRRLTTQTFTDVNNLVYHHRAKWRLRGVNFPRMVAMLAPRVNAIKLCRADLDAPAIEARMVQFAQENPGITATEVAQAVAWAWPDYRPTSARTQQLREKIDERKRHQGHDGSDD